MPRKPDRSVAILLIAVFKLLKALLLLGVGIAALKLTNANLGDTLTKWAGRLHVAPGNRHLQELLAHSLSISPKKLELVAAVTFVYAAMFGTEGIGLLMGKRWAEYMTVVTTAGLMPLEGYEIFKHANGLKIAALVINAAAVAYLVVRLWKTKGIESSDHRVIESLGDSSSMTQ